MIEDAARTSSSIHRSNIRQPAHVLVFEPFKGGHHTNYVMVLARALAERKRAGELRAVTLGLSRAHAGTGPLKGLIQELSGDVGVHLIDRAIDPGLPWRERLRLSADLANAIAASDADQVVLTSGDSETLVAAFRPLRRLRRAVRAVQVVTILHCGYAGLASTLRDKLKDLMYRLALARAPWHRTLHVNPLVYERALKKCRSYRPDLLPDPVPIVPPMDRFKARQRLGLDVNGTYVGHVGAIDKRKAIPELIEAFASVAREDERLLLAGQAPPHIRAMVEERHDALVSAGKIILLDKHLDEEEFVTALAALDLVAPLHYARAELSANFLKAVAIRRPVLVDQFGYTGMMVRRFGLGTATDVRDRAMLAKALRHALSSARIWEPDAYVDALIDFHDPRNFTDVIFDALGLTPNSDPLARSWFGAPAPMDGAGATHGQAAPAFSA